MSLTPLLEVPEGVRERVGGASEAWVLRSFARLLLPATLSQKIGGGLSLVVQISLQESEDESSSDGWEALRGR
jgi:hypothetical protein